MAGQARTSRIPVHMVEVIEALLYRGERAWPQPPDEDPAAGGEP